MYRHLEISLHFTSHDKYVTVTGTTVAGIVQRGPETAGYSTPEEALYRSINHRLPLLSPAATISVHLNHQPVSAVEAARMLEREMIGMPYEDLYPQFAAYCGIVAEARPTQRVTATGTHIITEPAF